MSQVLDAVATTEFLAGFRYGLVAAALVILTRLVRRGGRGRQIGLIGVLWTGAAIAGGLNDGPLELYAGLALLGLAGLLLKVAPLPGWSRSLAAVPGAWLIAGHSGLSTPGWVPWLVFSVIVGAAPLVAATDDRDYRAPLGPLLWAMTVAGVYLDVPDTEQMLVLSGAAAPLALLGWPANLARLGSFGGYLAVGLLAWAIAQGGAGRPASIIGGLACLGMFVVLPVAERLTGGRSSNRVLILILHAAVVAIASRWAGHQVEPVAAAAISTAALGLALAISVVVLRGDRIDTIHPP